MERVYSFVDFNQNDKIDFNELLVTIATIKGEKGLLFKRIQNIFSPPQQPPGTGAGAATPPEPTDSNLNRGVCMGKIPSLDSACKALDNETDCNADNKCNWASAANIDDGTTWSAGGAGSGEQEQYEQDFRRAPKFPGYDPDGV